MTVNVLLLRNATLASGQRADVRLRAGLIDAVLPAGQGGAGSGLDLSGYLLLPAPVETHAHLDKAYTADLVGNPTGDLPGAVAGWISARSSFHPDDITARATQAIRAYVRNGATAIRTHVDVGTDIGLRAVEAVLAAKSPVPVQVVAFAATPLSGVAGADNRALLREALDAGATVLGACPGLDPDPASCLKLCLAMAQERQVPVDFHIDEWLDPASSVLALLADAVPAGFAPAVTASHCVSLGMMEPDRILAVAEKVAAAGISVVCLPQTNLYLQARQHLSAPPRGLPPLAVLRHAGVTVAAGGDNLQDPFHPLGRADPLETAALLVQAGHQSPQHAYAAVSQDARRVLGLPQVRVAAGFPAELLAVRAGNVREAIAAAAPDRLVIHCGNIIARTTSTEEWPA